MIYMFCYVSGSALLKINTEKRKQKGQMCQLAHRDKQEGNQERHLRIFCFFKRKN